MNDAYPVMQAITACSFDHLQFFVDDLKPLSHYKAIEDRLNKFGAKCPFKHGWDVDAARKAWCEMGASADPAEFQVHGRDLVEQQLHGVGWRITGQHEGTETRSLLLSTPDPNGVRFVITAANSDTGPAAKKAKTDSYDHFALSHMKRYFKYHNGAQGVAVLGFQLAPGELDIVADRYKAFHPKLVVEAPHTYEGGVRTLDVFAYYLGEKGVSDADPGTVLRFVERAGGSEGEMPLPGLEPVAAEFDPSVLPAYADHWVSNVKSRVGFLQTLEETLGFVPKVDFNAGVVAAGEAQIESTVMGNASSLVTTDPKAALTDRGQIFLPTNNALSPVGHVHWCVPFLLDPNALPPPRLAPNEPPALGCPALSLPPFDSPLDSQTPWPPLGTLCARSVLPFPYPSPLTGTSRSSVRASSTSLRASARSPTTSSAPTTCVASPERGTPSSTSRAPTTGCSTLRCSSRAAWRASCSGSASTA